VMHPMDKIPEGDDKLSGFSWRINQKPVSKESLRQPEIIESKKKK